MKRISIDKGLAPVVIMLAGAAISAQALKNVIASKSNEQKYWNYEFK